LNEQGDWPFCFLLQFSEAHSFGERLERRQGDWIEPLFFTTADFVTRNEAEL
jgi:hypothetical protein